MIKKERERVEKKENLQKKGSRNEKWKEKQHMPMQQAFQCQDQEHVLR